MEINNNNKFIFYKQYIITCENIDDISFDIIKDYINNYEKSYNKGIDFYRFDHKYKSIGIFNLIVKNENNKKYCSICIYYDLEENCYYFCFENSKEYFNILNEGSFKNMNGDIIPNMDIFMYNLCKNSGYKYLIDYIKL